MKCYNYSQLYKIPFEDIEDSMDCSKSQIDDFDPNEMGDAQMDTINRSRRKTKSKLSKKSIELADRSEKKEMKDAEKMIQKLREGL